MFAFCSREGDLTKVQPKTRAVVGNQGLSVKGWSSSAGKVGPKSKLGGAVKRVRKKQ